MDTDGKQTTRPPRQGRFQLTVLPPAGRRAKLQRTGALQNAARGSSVNSGAKRLGVRRPSAALSPAGHRCHCPPEPRLRGCRRQLQAHHARSAVQLDQPRPCNQERRRYLVAMPAQIAVRRRRLHHHPGPPQQLQMLGDARLAHARRRHKIIHGQRAAGGQPADDGQPRLISERLKQAGRLNHRKRSRCGRNIVGHGRA